MKEKESNVNERGKRHKVRMNEVSGRKERKKDNYRKDNYERMKVVWMREGGRGINLEGN